jgi:hypothetical protein
MTSLINLFEERLKERLKERLEERLKERLKERPQITGISPII